MEKIVTATGQEFDCDYLSCISQPCRLYFRILNESLVKVSEIFGNPENTCRITYCGHIWEGYTNLVFISIEESAIKVALTKP